MEHRPRRADRAPGRCWAGGGLLGGKDPAGRFFLPEEIEQVVVAGRSLVLVDHSEHVHVEQPKGVNPTADPLAVAAAGTGATLGFVVRDGTFHDREDRQGARVRWMGGRRVVVDTAAESLTTIGGHSTLCGYSPIGGHSTIAPLRPVGGERAARDGDDAPKDVCPAASQRRAAAAADGPVMWHPAIAECNLATPGNTERVPAIIPETAAAARV